MRIIACLRASWKTCGGELDQNGTGCKLAHSATTQNPAACSTASVNVANTVAETEMYLEDKRIDLGLVEQSINDLSVHGYFVNDGLNFHSTVDFILPRGYSRYG